jgi:hypothetical protein
MTGNDQIVSGGPNYLNQVVLSGRVESLPTLREFDSMPPQLQIHLEIVMKPGMPPLTQPVVFMDPDPEMVEAAMGAMGTWAYFAGVVASAVIDGQWETHVIGSEIRFIEPPSNGRAATDERQ